MLVLVVRARVLVLMLVWARARVLVLVLARAQGLVLVLVLVPSRWLARVPVLLLAWVWAQVLVLLLGLAQRRIWARDSWVGRSQALPETYAHALCSVLARAREVCQESKLALETLPS